MSASINSRILCKSLLKFLFYIEGVKADRAASWAPLISPVPKTVSVDITRDAFEAVVVPDGSFPRKISWESPKALGRRSSRDQRGGVLLENRFEQLSGPIDIVSAWTRCRACKTRKSRKLIKSEDEGHCARRRTGAGNVRCIIRSGCEAVRMHRWSSMKRWKIGNPRHVQFSPLPLAVSPVARV